MSNSVLLNALKLCRGVNEKDAADEFAAFAVEGFVFCSASECFYKKDKENTLIVMMPLHGKNRFYYPVIFKTDGIIVYVSFFGDKINHFIPIQDNDTLNGILSDYKISINIQDSIIRGFSFEF